MLCPQCGAQMKEGKLYCEQCGAEIRIVPDYEPELENSIRETLSTVAEEIRPEASKESDPEKERNRQIEEEFLKESRIFHGITSRKRILITVLGAVLMTLLLVLLVTFIYQKYSVSYQLDRAESAMDAEQYEQALMYLERARKLDVNDSKLTLLEAQCHIGLGDQGYAAELLEEAVTARVMDEDTLNRCYDLLIPILDTQEEYERINGLLLLANDTKLQTRFSQYLAMKPEFGYATGNYEQVISLKITANTTGTIYYTTDGSVPDQSSEVYTVPLLLDPGEHRIRAVFVNDYGIVSEEAENYYLIDVAVPEKPQVSLESGEYHEPCTIEVTSADEGKIYYTTDGSNPTENSLLYTQPIDMPLGRTNYRFVVISEDQVMSEVVYRSYDLELNTLVTVNVAVDSVKRALMEQHVLKDMQGKSFEIEGIYVYEYETLVEIPDLGYYYKLNEYVQENGVRTPTGRLYAVEVYSGVPNRLVYYENGQMGIIPLNK